ncbi:MAG TPA: hypothetical protein VD862_03755 [Candidatus Paceibacterota bacterium]|nr:hypothetical protein [Candidatus Paceibacterota bacterium]
MRRDGKNPETTRRERQERRAAAAQRRKRRQILRQVLKKLPVRDREVIADVFADDLK